MRRIGRAITLAVMVMVVVLVLAGSLSAAAAGPNLVRNAGFSRGVQGNGVPLGWVVSVPTDFTRSDSVFHIGPASGLIQGEVGGRVKAWQHVRGITGDTSYQVSAWMLVSSVNDPSLQVLFEVRWLDAANQLIQTDTVAQLTSGSEAFTNQSAVLTAPTLATAARIRFTTIDLLGAVFVDTVVFQKVP